MGWCTLGPFLGKSVLYGLVPEKGGPQELVSLQTNPKKPLAHAIGTFRGNKIGRLSRFQHLEGPLNCFPCYFGVRNDSWKGFISWHKSLLFACLQNRLPNVCGFLLVSLQSPKRPLLKKHELTEGIQQLTAPFAGCWHLANGSQGCWTSRGHNK